MSFSLNSLAQLEFMGHFKVRGKERENGRKERDGRDMRKHFHLGNKFLVTALRVVVYWL